MQTIFFLLALFLHISLHTIFVPYITFLLFHLFSVLLLDKRKFSLLLDIIDPGKGLSPIATAIQTASTINEDQT